MKAGLTMSLLLLAGVVTGGGAGYAVQRLVAPRSENVAVADPAQLFVPVPRILAPLVMADGRLAGYVSFDLALEIAADGEPAVTQQLPLLLHAINMRSYRAPLAAGPDGMLPDIDALRRLALTAANEAFGKGVVRRVAVTRAEPG